MTDYTQLSNEALDALWAERGAGFGKRVRFVPGVAHALIDDAFPVAVRPYSSDIGAAWSVAERVIKGRHVRFSLTQGSHMMPHAEFFDVATGRERYEASADTMPRAIVIAALQALDRAGGGE